MPVNISQDGKAGQADVAEDVVKVQVTIPGKVWRAAKSKAVLAGKTNAQLLVAALELYVDQPKEGKAA